MSSASNLKSPSKLVLILDGVLDLGRTENPLMIAQALNKLVFYVVA